MRLLSQNKAVLVPVLFGLARFVVVLSALFLTAGGLIMTSVLLTVFEYDVVPLCDLPTCTTSECLYHYWYAAVSYFRDIPGAGSTLAWPFVVIWLFGYIRKRLWAEYAYPVYLVFSFFLSRESGGSGLESVQALPQVIFNVALNFLLFVAVLDAARRIYRARRVVEFVDGDEAK